MAIIRASMPLNMLDSDVYYGALTKYNSTTIEITSGDVVSRYTGSFTYDGSGNVYGQLKGYEQLVNGRVAGSVSGVNIDAYDFADALDDEDIDEIYQMVLSGSDEFHGSGGRDVILGLGGNDVIRGNGGNDNLAGDGGADTLYAGTGSDKLNGGRGKDTLYGGTDSAKDVFVFNSRYDSSSDRRDIIHNFTRNVDDIDLRGIDAKAGSRYTNEAFSWSGKTADEHSVWWKSTDKGVVVRADVTGDTQADFEFLLAGVTSVGSGDFLL